MSWEDWVDLGSLAADLGSAISAQVPGWGTVTSAGLGLASSVSQMVTDVSRDGLDKRDVKNLLTNVGFDLFGLVPGAGLTAKSAVNLHSCKYKSSSTHLNISSLNFGS